MLKYRFTCTRKDGSEARSWRTFRSDRAACDAAHISCVNGDYASIRVEYNGRHVFTVRPDNWADVFDAATIERLAALTQSSVPVAGGDKSDDDRRVVEAFLTYAADRVANKPDALPFAPVYGRLVIAWLRALSWGPL